MRKLVLPIALALGLFAATATAAPVTKTQTLGPPSLEEPSLNLEPCLGEVCFGFNTHVSGAIIAAPEDGTITSWSMRSGEIPISLLQEMEVTPTVFRDLGDGNWVEAAQGTPQTISSNEIATFPENLPIKAGQVFGVEVPRFNFLPIVIDLDLSDSSILDENFTVPVNVPFFHLPVNAELTTVDDPGGPDEPEIDEKCRGKVATIVGTSGADQITGTPGPDVIVAKGGSDTINSLAGDDVICSNGGDDTVDSGPGRDRVYGGDGDDEINTGGGNDWAFGLGGADEISGGSGADRLSGNAGIDLIDGGSNADWLRGGRDADRMLGQSGSDYLQGAWGNDVLLGGPGNDNLRGGNDDDMLDGGSKKDRCKGGNGSDQMKACP